MSPRLSDVGPLEMKVLGLLDSKPSPGLSVAEIQAELNLGKKDELAYTTVMTVLVRLLNKGYLKREKSGRQYFYALADSSGQGSTLLARVKQTLFGNQRLQPILALLEAESRLTEDELKELRRAIDMRLKKTQGKSS